MSAGNVALAVREYDALVPTIGELLDPAYVEGLDTLALSEVRSRRDQCQEVADEVSYLRRLVQGRLDLLHAEQERRAEGRPPDMAALVEQLKEGQVLSDRTRPGGLGRLPRSFEPPDRDGWISRDLDDILDAERLWSLPELDDDELAELAIRLIELERKVSDRRALLHDRTNELQAEIVRRYKSGLANVDEALRA